MGWFLQASCRGVDTKLFFSTDEETNSERLKREQRAKAFCAICPVTAECLEAGKNEDGIWGGKTRSERTGLTRHRQPLERLLVQASAVTDSPWAIIESNGNNAIWQRDSKLTWHGFEWAVVKDGKIIKTENELSDAYALFGTLLQS